MKNKKSIFILSFVVFLFFTSFLIQNKVVYEESDNLEPKPRISSPGPITLLWNRTWHDGFYYSKAYEIALDSFNNSYLAGYSVYGPGIEDDVWLLKYNSSGGLVWSERWGFWDDEAPKAIVINSANDIYIAGYTQSFGGSDYDVFIFKYNSSGDEQWWDYWGGNDDDDCNGMVIDGNNNIFLGGIERNIVISVNDHSITIIIIILEVINGIVLGVELVMKEHTELS